MVEAAGVSPFEREVTAMLLAFSVVVAIALIIGFVQTWRKGR